MDSCDPPESSSDCIGSTLVPRDMSDLLCDPCLEDGNHVQAEGYCVDCAHHLCGICFLHHCTPRPWRNHQLLDKQRMPQTKSDKIYKDECTDKCTRHKGKSLKYFCRDHKSLECKTCVTLEHRTCKMDDISTVSGDILKSREYKGFKRDIESLTYRTQSAKEASTRNLEDVEQHAERAMAEIKRIRKEIDKFFDDLVNDISERVTQIRREDRANIEAILEQCEALGETIRHLKTDIDDKESKNMTCRLFVDVKQQKDAIDAYKTCLDSMEKGNSIRDLTFRLPGDVSSLINDKSKWSGSLVDFHQSVTIKTSTGIWSNHRGITGITALSNGIVFVLDEGGRCLRSSHTTLDKQITLKNPVRVSSRYKQTLTRMSENEIALSYNDSIYIYSVTDEFKEKKTIRISGRVLGFNYTDSTFITCTLESRSTIRIVYMRGAILKTFHTEINGETLGKCPWCITVSPDHTAIYMSDSDKQTVICQTFDGQVKSQYKPSNRWSPAGVTVSRDGRVFVCDQSNGNIHILTSDLKEMGMIIGKKYKLSYPQVLAYSDREHKLYVGTSKDSIISVFNV